ncbi:MAG: NAD-dependent epimerase/dehydratase family protein [Acidimicrobiia bacterium]|nr:GDP-mannose 4,6-dehydratase [bacterium]MXX64939.1 NAD-dependent epimerase/dehydratase family protein [Acidimicrobiia bacterium]MCY3580304.1 GDP-mannose 4,6-dehydratase [bacterium]MCY3653092.1 GDP-mannose 4,6-dehydratase [bacterium]MDE0643604.1 GDP-mannose 4,6-dehydratase [bacterium]
MWRGEPTQGRALVTGGAGFLGSNLVDRLVAEGWEVMVLDNLSTGRLSYLDDARRFGHITIHQIDIRSEHLAATVAKYSPDRIFHLAAQTSVSASVASPGRDADINVIGTLNLLESARLAGTSRLVFVSTGGAIYGSEAPLPTPEDAPLSPESPYGFSKLIAEQYLDFWGRHHGPAYSIIRPSNVYGPRQDSSGEGGVVAIFAAACRERKPPTIFGSGHDTRDYVYVDDVVDAIVRAADQEEGGVYNIGTGVETSTLALFGMVADAAWFKGKPFHGPPRPGDVPRSALECSRARRELGWRPRIALKDGIKATVDWFVENRPR